MKTSGNKEFKEKRKYPRKVCLIDVDYATEDRAYKDFTKNISRKGVFIETRNPLSVGQKVILTIPLAGDPGYIKINGEIVRGTSQGLGVKFKDALREPVIGSILENIKLAFTGPESKEHHIAKKKLESIRRQLRRKQLAFILPNFFGPLDESILQDIEARIEWVRLRRDEILLRQGDAGDSCYIVVHGRLQAVTRDQEGEEQAVGEVARGECVGEMSIFTGEARTATIYAIRDSELVKFSKPAFERIIKQHPQVMMNIVKILITRLRKAIRSPSSAATVTNIAVVSVSAGVPLTDFAARLIEGLSVFGSTLHLNSGRLDEIMGLAGTAQTPENSPYSIKLETWLDEQENRYRYIIYEADATFSPWTVRCLQQADQILLVVRAAEEPAPSEIGEVLASPDSGVPTARRSLVLMHPDGSRQPSDTAHWLAVWPVRIHHHLRWDNNADFDRLARFLTGNAIGLVLGGGGARGFAHLGIIRALLEAGIPIDMIGGASMGAIIATAYAMGLDYDTSIRKARENFIDTNPFDDYTLPLISLTKSRKLDYIVKSNYGEINIEDLWVNYFSVSSNLTTAETVVHRRGRLWKAVRASASIPGIAVPVLENGSLLVDGGVLNNLPVEIMKALCGGHVIAVDVSANRELSVDYDKIPSLWEFISRKIVPFKKSFNIPNILDVMARTAMLGSINRTHLVRMHADFYLQPPLDRFKLMDFTALEEIAEIGYRYTGQKIEEIKSREPFKTLLESSKE